MPISFGDRTAQTTTSTGTGSLLLNGPAPDSWNTFSETIPNGRGCHFLIQAANGLDTEISEGILTYGSPPSLSRDRVIRSKLGGVIGTSKIPLAPGTHFVTCVWTAEDADLSNPVLFTPAVTAGALVIDLDRSTDSFHRVTLNANIIDGGISFINPPPGICRVYIEFWQATPNGTVYDIPISAWTGGPGTVTFDTDYFVYQDWTPTIVSLISTDGMVTARARNNAELLDYLNTADINTLAKINAIVADTDLVATNDARLTDSRPVTVKKNNSAVGIRPILNFHEGTNITLSIVDDDPGNEVDITITSSGGGGGGSLPSVEIDCGTVLAPLVEIDCGTFV